MAINVTDGKLFFNQSGTIKVLANATYATSVSTISFGTTGLTPSTATNGVVTVAGTLATTNGGTGLTSFTANGVVYASSTSALATGSALTFDGNKLVTNALSFNYYTGAYTLDGTISNYASSNSLYVNGNAGGYLTLQGAGNQKQQIGINGSNSGGEIFFQTNGAERARIDSNGNLLVGDTNNAGSNRALFYKTGANSIRVGSNTNASFRGYEFGASGSDSTAYGSIKMELIGGQLQIASGYSGFGGYTTFYTNGSEAMRLDTTGNLLVGTTSGSFHIFSKNNSSNYMGKFQNTASSDPYGLVLNYPNNTPNSVANEFLYCTDSTGLKASIRSNGGIANYAANNAILSDRREKTNFAPATSYLDKICAIPVQTFNYIDQNLEEDGGLTLGVVAQDVQAVAPELITEGNWGTKENPKMRLEIYQTDLQYALMKCIQEQQALITQLTTRLTALENK